MDAPLPDPLSGGAAHILLVSLPAPGHLFPFTSFAHQLAAAGAQVTCLTTGYVFEHLQHRGDHQYKQSSSSSNGRVRFEGLLEFKEVHEVTVANVLEGWGQALSDEEMGAALEGRFLELQPRPCCIVADMFQAWVQDVATKLHVPRHTLFTMPAKDLAFVLRVPELLERGELPINPAGAGKRDDILLPGMAPIPAEDVWRAFQDASHPHHQFFVRSLSRLSESSSVILNTFEELEAETLKALRTDFVIANIKVPEILPILLTNIPRMQRRGPNATNGDDHVSDVEKWLDTQAPASVIYVSFGSLVTLTEQQTGALALALEAAKYPFVWVYRPPGIPQVSGQTSTSNSVTHENIYEYFPPGFRDRVSGRAMLISGWAPQPHILTHHAIGAFLTHCGWNSILESVCAGVPMLAWPIAVDQKINARFMTDTAQVGLRIHRNADDTVSQDEIERVLKQMMEGEEGKAARSKALKFQLLAQKNVADHGESRTNLDKFIHKCTPASPSA